MAELRIILVGGPASELCLAAGMARELGADIRLATAEQAPTLIESHRADLLMVEVGRQVEPLMVQLRAAGISVPVVACGVGRQAEQAVAAIRAGCVDYLPLPPDDEALALIQALLGEQPAEPVHGLIGRRMADVERALILRTLEQCGGNRTSAAGLLGISVRTMRNKLRSFIDAGYPVSPAA